MIKLVAFDLDGTLALSKQAILPSMATALTNLLATAQVAVISGGDWPQFEKQIVAQLPADANLSNLWLMPTTGTKLYRYTDGPTDTNTNTKGWQQIYADVFSQETKTAILSTFESALASTGFTPTQTWGERIEDRGTQITFSALGQQAPIDAKSAWDPDFAKRKVIQAELCRLLPDLSINMGGATSIDITRRGVDKGFGLRRLSEYSRVELREMVFVGDAIFPGGNDYPAKQLGLRTVDVLDPNGTLAAIAGIIACLS